MKIETRAFGTIEIDEDKVITFVEPLLGFEGVVRYAVLDQNPGGPFKVLQVTEEPDRAFLVADPAVLFPDYAVQLTPEQVRDLELQDPEDAAVLVVVTIRQDPKRLTANLKGPIVVNAKRLLAKQVVMPDRPVDAPVDLELVG